MNEIIRYLIDFLVGEEKLVPKIGYTSERSKFKRYKLVIIPSGFFDCYYGLKESLPALPLKELEGIPILYGKPKVETVDKTVVIHADLIASAYFMLSRYEEMVRTDGFDKHERFRGKKSLPYRAGFIHRPILDEYRVLIRSYLGRACCEKLSIVDLTHDIDEPFLYRSAGGFVRSLRDGRGLWTSLKGVFGKPENDPYYTFPWLAEQNSILDFQDRRVNTILFFKAAEKPRFQLFGKKQGYAQDKPYYDLKSRAIRNIPHYFYGKNRPDCGLHISYEIGYTGLYRKLKGEKMKFNREFEFDDSYSRNHFLIPPRPSDMYRLADAGITIDYTMGYADIAGFRLGTSQMVQCIDPVRRKLVDGLSLCPLLIMDSTLEDPKYMGLDHDEALAYCRLLLKNTVKNGEGIFSILWHNSSVAEGKNSYLRQLYAEIIELIRTELEKDIYK